MAQLRVAGILGKNVPARYCRNAGAVSSCPCLRFQSLVGEVTEHPVAVYQRIDQAGQRLPLDERILADTDTLMVFGLDHMVTEQEASPEEIEAVRQFLTREGTCWS